MKYLIALAALALVACEKAPVSVSSTNNPGVPVEKMFTNDGCTVYRFWDNGRYHYYTNCTGSVETPEHMQGKITIPEDTIPTWSHR